MSCQMYNHIHTAFTICVTSPMDFYLVIFSATNTILVDQASSGRLMVSRLLVGSPIMK